jgi:hypothetical protein
MRRFIGAIVRASTALADLVNGSAPADRVASAPSKMCADSAEELNVDYYALADAGGSFIMATTPHCRKARQIADLAQSKDAASGFKPTAENERKTS